MAKSLKYATVAGKHFQGETVADAKAKGQDLVARMIYEADLGPSVYHVNGMTALIFPNLYDTWTYTLLNGKEAGLVNASTCISGGTRQQVSLDAISHMTQATWSLDVVDDEEFYRAALSVYRVNSDVGAMLQRESKIKDGVVQAGWQRRYRAAVDVCGDKNMAHDVASRTRTIQEAINLATRETGIAA